MSEAQDLQDVIDSAIAETQYVHSLFAAIKRLAENDHVILGLAGGGICWADSTIEHLETLLASIQQEGNDHA
jgi:hypothetical protein